MEISVMEHSRIPAESEIEGTAILEPNYFHNFFKYGARLILNIHVDARSKSTRTRHCQNMWDSKDIRFENPLFVALNMNV